MRFSNPSRAAFEKRRLCASAQTRSSRASAAVEIDNDRTARNPAATRRALLPSPLWAGLSHLALVRSPIGILESGLFLLRNFRIQRVAPAHNWNRKFPNAIPLPAGGGETPPPPSLSRVRKGASFDDLVGAGEERRRKRQAERFGGAEVDDELELARRLHGQLA